MATGIRYRTNLRSPLATRMPLRCDSDDPLKEERMSPDEWIFFSLASLDSKPTTSRPMPSDCFQIGSFPSLQCGEYPGAVVAHLLLRHACMGCERNTEFDELLHADVLQEPAVLIAVSAIIGIRRSVGIRSQKGIVWHRNGATLAESGASGVFHDDKTVPCYKKAEYGCLQIRENGNNRCPRRDIVRMTLRHVGPVRPVIPSMNRVPATSVQMMNVTTSTSFSMQNGIPSFLLILSASSSEMTASPNIHPTDGM